MLLTDFVLFSCVVVLATGIVIAVGWPATCTQPQPLRAGLSFASTAITAAASARHDPNPGHPDKQARWTGLGRRRVAKYYLTPLRHD
jgi:hypothetical protein